MNVGAVITSLATAVETAKKVVELSDRTRNAELKLRVADLMNDLADVKIKLAELKDRIAELKDENDALKSKKAEPKPTLKWGCYVFEGDDRLYCPGCYDSQGKKHLTTRVNSTLRRCTVCRTELGS